MSKGANPLRYKRRIIVGNYSQSIHCDKKALETMFREKFDVKDILISHETADEECPHIHTHFVVVLNKEKEFNCGTYLDFKQEGKTYHPWVDLRPGVTIKNLADHWNYICKEDNKDRKMEKVVDWVKKMVECEKGKELENCKKANEVIPALAIGATKKRIVIKKTDPMTKKWQWNLFDELKGNANRRKVIWYSDEVGGSGKTILCDNLMALGDNNWIILNGGNLRDVATVLETAVDRGWTGWGLVIDLPRCTEGYDHGIYSVIEACKNGRIQVSKYKGGVLELPQSAHVVVMSNHLPEMKRLSADRWDIRVLKGGALEEDELLRQFVVLEGANVKSAPSSNITPAASLG